MADPTQSTGPTEPWGAMKDYLSAQADPEKPKAAGASKPRPFELADPDERARLLRETVGYAKVGLHYGTDTLGRELAYYALAAAFASGYTLEPPK